MLKSVLKVFALTQHKKFTIGFSGGKDSATLVLALELLQKYVQFEFDVVTFDPRFPGFKIAEIKQILERLKCTSKH